MLAGRQNGGAGGLRVGLAVLAAVALLSLWWALARPIAPDAPPPMPPAVVVSALADGVTATFAASEAAGVVTGAVTGAAAPLHVAGRVAVDADWPEGFRHGWPGTVVTARFTGPAVELRLIDGVNRWRVTVDGQADVVLTRPGNGVLRIAGLGDGPHSLRAEKLNEAWEDAVFGGVIVPPVGAALDVTPPARLIEVFGDSDALGYGLRSDDRTCHGDDVYLDTDATGAFPALVARALGADLDLVARSGIGLLRDFSPSGTGGRMIDLAEAAAFGPGVAPAPQVRDRLVMIALGANDFEAEFAATDPWPDDAALIPDFAAALHGFARDRASPGAQVLLVAFGDYGDDLVTAHKAALAALQADGVNAGLVVLPDMARRACDWHMDAADHATAAGQIIAALAVLPRPWQPVVPAE